jgi:hypothetical protein
VPDPEAKQNALTDLADYAKNEAPKQIPAEATLDKIKEYAEWIMDLAGNNGLNTNELAYIYATTQVESQWYHFEELSEYGWDPYIWFESQYGRNTQKGRDLGNVNEGDGYLFRGRGFIHLTGRAVYRNVGQGIGVGTLLEDYPDKAFMSEANGGYITKIAVIGMKDGLMTGQKLSDYNLGGGAYDFTKARDIINPWRDRDITAQTAQGFADILLKHYKLGGLSAGIILPPGG